MQHTEYEYITRFQDIIEAYGRRSEGPEEAKKAAGVALHNIDSLTYTDMPSLRKAIAETFNRKSTPREFEGFLERMLFVERFILEEQGCEKIAELVCVNFIDNGILLKCKRWLDDFDSAEKLFLELSIENTAYKKKSPYAEECFAQGDLRNNLGDLFPFSESWGTGDINGIFSMSGGHGQYEMITQPKQRGKAAPVRKDVTSERPFVCEVENCSRAFKRMEHLKRHLKMHTGERPFKCYYPGCDRSFSRSDNLHSHYRVHNLATRKNFCRFRNIEEDPGQLRRIEK